jgi:acetyltransferase-like isoleucine patch superfamily enzyme
MKTLNQLKMRYSIHPSADVQSDKIGEGTVIWQNCVVLEGAIIGKCCNLNYNVFVENDVVIGDHVTIKSGVQIWDGITIEDYVFIGPNATFTNDIFPRSKSYPEKFVRTLVEEGASIGANATILAGNHIGRYSMIGAGSVITKDVPPFTLWYGNPALHKGFITRNGIVLNRDYVDKDGIKHLVADDEPLDLDYEI